MKSKAQHLIEVTVVEFTAIPNAESVAAHQAFHSRRIEAVCEQFEVFIPSALLAQILGKAGNGLVCDRIEFVENNPEFLLKDTLVVGFEFRLGSGQRGADRIVNEVQWQPSSIAHCVQLSKSRDAPFKNSCSALSRDVFFRVAGKRGDYFDVMFTEKVRQPGEGRLFNDRKIIPIDHAAAGAP